MISPSVKLILCDLGNVLIDFDHRIAVRRIQSFTQKAPDSIYQLFFDSSLTKHFEEGRLSSFDFYRRIAAELELENISFRLFTQIWNEIFFPNIQMLEVLKKLKKKYPLHLVSNINALHYGYIKKMFPQSLSIFEKIICSHKVGCRKPDPLIYRRAIAGARARFSEVLYTDDRADLIQYAGKLGMKTIVFKNANDFVKKLKKFEIYL